MTFLVKKCIIIVKKMYFLYHNCHFLQQIGTWDPKSEQKYVILFLEKFPTARGGGGFATLKLSQPQDSQLQGGGGGVRPTWDISIHTQFFFLKSSLRFLNVSDLSVLVETPLQEWCLGECLQTSCGGGVVEFKSNTPRALGKGVFDLNSMSVYVVRFLINTMNIVTSLKL